MAISGFSGSGKTTLIEQLIPHLNAKGLKVAVLKHDVHGIQVDREGKDSDRLYRAGADVVLHGPGEHFRRQHDEGGESLMQVLASLSRQYDLVLVEGHKEMPLAKIWLLDDKGTSPPEDKQNIIDVYTRDEDRVSKALDLLKSWLPNRWQQTPVYGCVLIGGKSTRMGQPKHLLEQQGRSWLEHTLAQVEQVVERVVIVGQGDIPGHLSHYAHLPDVPEIHGPMAGMMSAMRWANDVSWLMCACDMPKISIPALQWLLDQRAPGTWAILPDLHNNGFVEPLLAHYDPRALGLFEALVGRQIFGPSALARHAKVISPAPPEHISNAWQNVNTPDELASLDRVRARHNTDE